MDVPLPSLPLRLLLAQPSLPTPVRFNFKSHFRLCSDRDLKTKAVIWPKDYTAKGGEYLGPWGAPPSLQDQAVPAVLVWRPQLSSGGGRKAEERIQHLRGEADSLEIALAQQLLTRNRPGSTGHPATALSLRGTQMPSASSLLTSL